MRWKRVAAVIIIVMTASLIYPWVARAASNAKSGMDNAGVFHTSPPDGPYPVGVKLIDLDFEGRRLPVVIWYPAQKVEGAEPYVFVNDSVQSKVQGAAILDAPPDNSKAPYPLIVFSPGVGAAGDAYVFYTQNLASYGYVVVGISYPEDANQSTQMLFENGNLGNLFWFFPQVLSQFLNNNSSDVVLTLYSEHFRETQFGLTYRPQETSFVMDHAAEWTKDPSSPFHGMIDANNIGLTGHSLGAWISLLYGGMTVKPNPECTGNLSTDWIASCDPGNTQAAQALGPARSLLDPRVKAIIPLASPIFNRDILRNARNIRTPMMIITGDNPVWESTFSMQWDVYQSARSAKYMVKIKDTDHFVVSDVLQGSYIAKFLPLPFNGGNFDQKAQGYKDYSAAFFNLYLKKDKSMTNILKAPNQPFVVQVWSKK
jgi:predicted dienelactone hydrolase